MAVLLQEGLALSSRTTTTTTTTTITSFSSCCKFSSSLWDGIIRAPGVFVASTTGSSSRRKLVVKASSSGSGATKVKNSRRYNITLLPGDGIGPEIMRVAVDVLKAVGTLEGIQFEFTEKLVGGAAIDAVGDPLPEDTLKSCKESDSVLLAAIGGYKWDKNPRELKPETGLLKLRAGLGVFANFRPATVFPQLVDASPLKNEIADSVDIMVVRELIGGSILEHPGDLEQPSMGIVQASTLIYILLKRLTALPESLLRWLRKDNARLCSVDKANVLEVSQLWRERVTAIGAEYPDVNLTHMYVDNAAMQLIRNPKQFDTIVTSNLFGDILSDEASMLTGSIGMLPSASISASGPGLYEPIHGSAPDIAGQDKANPLAQVLSVAMLLRFGLGEATAADRIEAAVMDALHRGYRTGDIMSDGKMLVGCCQMGEILLEALGVRATASLNS